jgi:hypothetical protein
MNQWRWHALLGATVEKRSGSTAVQYLDSTETSQVTTLAFHIGV